MRRGGTTALFCAFRLEYNRNIKKFLQADLIFLCTIFLRTGLISMSIPNRRCVLP